MKINFGVYIVFLLSLLSHNMLAQGPILHLPCNGNGDNNFVGGSTAEMHNVIVGEDKNGNSCGALYFNGLNSYLAVPVYPKLNSINQAFSLTCWLKASQSNGSIGYTILCKGSNSLESDNNPAYRVQLFQTNVNSTISLNTEFTEYDQSYASHLIKNNTWQYFALTYDGNMVSVYLDSSLVWSYSANTIFNSNMDSLYIGKDSPGALEYFNGAIDELKLYNYAIDKNQIKADMQLGVKNSNLFEYTCLNDAFYFTDKKVCFSKINFKAPIATSDCGIASVKQILGLSSGDSFPVGDNLIAFRASTDFGLVKTCYTKYVVKDTIKPTIKCPKDTIALTSDSIYYKPAIFNASDNCSLKNVELVNLDSSRHYFTTGKYDFKFVATDIYENKEYCSYKLTVNKNKSTNKSVVPSIDSIPIVPFSPKSQIDSLDSHLITEVSVQDTIQIVDVVDSVVVNNEVKDSLFISNDDKKDVDVVKIITGCPKFSSNIITLNIYDDSEIDGDSISILFNGDTIVNRQIIKSKDEFKIIRNIMLIAGKENYLLIKAWNVGTTMPNTVKVDFYDEYFSKVDKKVKKKKPFYSTIYHTKPGLSNKIILNCN